MLFDHAQPVHLLFGELFPGTGVLTDHPILEIGATAMPPETCLLIPPLFLNNPSRSRKLAFDGVASVLLGGVVQRVVVWHKGSVESQNTTKTVLVLMYITSPKYCKENASQ